MFSELFEGSSDITKQTLEKKTLVNFYSSKGGIKHVYVRRFESLESFTLYRTSEEYVEESILLLSIAPVNILLRAFALNPYFILSLFCENE